MVDDTTDALYTLNRTTGRATRVNRFTHQFGLSITNPRGLAWNAHDSLLLLTTTAVYKLNKLTGAAERFSDSTIGLNPVPVASPFGTGITNAQGLAAQSKRLFMVDGTRDSLYVIDRSNGTASLIGRLRTATNATITRPSGLSMVGFDLYVSSTSPNALYKINRGTGKAVSSNAVALDTITGLAWSGSTMYAVDDATDALYTIPAIIQEPTTTPARSPAPNRGDLYYNGDVLKPPGIGQASYSYSFADSVMRWDNPHWQRPDRNDRMGCDVAVTDCSTYEHDLEIADRNWVRHYACTTWSNLPRPYDDCETAGFLDQDGLHVVSFGTYRAPSIRKHQIYYGSWLLSSPNTLVVLSTPTTKLILKGQEGAFRPRGGPREFIPCPRVHETPWCVFGIGGQVSLTPSKEGEEVQWRRGSSKYVTFRR